MGAGWWTWFQKRAAADLAGTRWMEGKHRHFTFIVPCCRALPARLNRASRWSVGGRVAKWKRAPRRPRWGLYVVSTTTSS